MTFFSDVQLDQTFCKSASFTMGGSQTRWRTAMPCLSALGLLVLLAALTSQPTIVSAAKHGDFKTCQQSSFCRRLRALSSISDNAGSDFHSPYTVSEPKHNSNERGSASWVFPVQTSLFPEIEFELKVDIQAGGIARLRVDEVNSKTQWKRYDEAAKHALLGEPKLQAKSDVKISTESGATTLTYGPVLSHALIIQHSPLLITQTLDSKPIMIINDRSLFHMEHFRLKSSPRSIEEIQAEEEREREFKGREVYDEEKDGDHEGKARKGRKWFLGEGEEDDGMWEEKWSKWTDSKPKGPEGLSFDVTFPGQKHIYGLPEHAAPLSLPSTESGPYYEPYRLYNVDIFEYEHSSPMAMYGAIPLVYAHSATHSVGLLSLTGSETLVDVRHALPGVQTHWMSESGIMDLFILPGPTPNALFEQYALLTGTTPLPPMWSIAYHQCRWNYLDENDVLEVNRRFNEEDIPLDVTWLDIEYAKEHRYFDWDKKVFPDPVRMLDAVAANGRKMVAIVDPHVKRTEDFRIYKDAQELDIIIKKSDGETNFDGWCWTGSSIWVDFFNEKASTWWKKMFEFDTWKDSTKALYIWNDMNEPSVFDGPEISMPRDAKHDGGWEHRDLHNINGMMFHKATHDALVVRETPSKRPFVLSRSYYAGSQRYGAVWTGDNMGTWEHFTGETAMLLSNNIAGMSFIGADVGGFFGNPSTEMLVRWYQAGAFMPFFRAHAHIDTKRREPYLYEEPYKGMMKDSIRLRYAMLSVWYTAFHEASLYGWPVIRPQFAVFPKDENGFEIDDQYYVGSSGILVKPVTAAGVESTKVYIADDQPYYNYFSHQMYPSASASREISVASPLETFPVLLQGGSIVPIRPRIRRSSTLMWRDPFTLVIAVGKDGSAAGKLYMDDGDSYQYRRGEYIWRKFELSKTGSRYALTNGPEERSKHASQLELFPKDVVLSEASSWSEGVKHVRVDRIIVLGLYMKERPKSVTIGKETLEWEWFAGRAYSDNSEGVASKLVIKDPKALVSNEWKIQIE